MSQISEHCHGHFNDLIFIQGLDKLFSKHCTQNTIICGNKTHSARLFVMKWQTRIVECIIVVRVKERMSNKTDEVKYNTYAPCVVMESDAYFMGYDVA